MRCFTSPLSILYLQLLLPTWLLGQSTASDIPSPVDSLIQVSRAHTATAEFEAAFVASAAAGERAVACCTENSVAYAAYCFNEGRIRYFQGEHEAALPWYLRAKHLRAELLGMMHVEYGKSLNNLAAAYKAMGDYAAAEPLYLETLKLRAQTLGKESAGYATVLANLSLLYFYQSNYDRAELLGLEAKAIRERVLGKEHVHYASSLLNLANIYYQTNNHARARNLYLEAKTNYENQESFYYYDYVKIIDNLGALYQQTGELDLAESHYREAAELRREVLGADHVDYAESLNHLAALYYDRQQFDQAELQLKASLKIFTEAGQAESPTYAYSLQDLGLVAFRQNRLAEAEEYIQQALTIMAKYLPKYDARYLKGLRDLARVQRAEAEYDAAVGTLKTLSDLEAKPLYSAVRHLSEDELANYTDDFKHHLDHYLTLAEYTPAIHEVCYDKILLYKGFLLTKALELRRVARTDEQAGEDYRALSELHRELAAMYTTTEVTEEALQVAEAKAYNLEKKLVRSSAAAGELLRQVDWRTVQAALPVDGIAVEFITYRPVLPAGFADVRYAALVVTPTSETPEFIALGRASELDKLLHNAGSSSAAFINELYLSTASGAVLYDLLWEPLVTELAAMPNLKKIYYSAAGLLHRINLGAVPTPSGKVLAQEYRLLALGSTRQLAESPPASAPEATSGALLYGGIDYGAVTKIANTETTSESQLVNPGRSYPDQRGYSAADGYWQPLPWTEVEILTAEEMLAETAYQPQLRMGAAATETSLKQAAMQAQSPRILHLATHGFFFPDPESGAAESISAFRASERSMIRSGLVLADGNYAWVNGRPRATATEDGILTAYEVSRMNLHQTELVILSACETGLGEIQGTEGVYGMQRAFKIAGARYLIMTLWQVPDFQAQAFMTTFYLAWLEEGKTIPEAFRAAQAYMRARYKDAFDWAGFVLLK